ncbi:udp-transferase [Sporothrix schenckii 1099-18]|uniref:Udp-transferase n=1 Tax=Sporothrix schenckii 1099-18 TaxID=1397361 RepID=A0A0F2LWG4_SPOSC|nr:udp-transferase [Sporothrix schenckii 1099-18]KJR80835.1 udp-transferase [Sporothrix schenckii 1099-18]
MADLYKNGGVARGQADGSRPLSGHIPNTSPDKSAAAEAGATTTTKRGNTDTETLSRPSLAPIDQRRPHSLLPPDQRRLHRPSHERLFSKMHEDDSLHYDPVNREGRSASVVRNDDGFIAYPSLIPPPVESPGASVSNINNNVGPRNDYLEAYPRPSGTFEGRPKAISDPPNPETVAAAGDSGGAPLATASTAIASSAVTPGARKTKSHGSSGTRPSRQRSSTLPMPPTRRNSNVALVQELRRTSLLHWGDLLEAPAYADEPTAGAASQNAYEGGPNLEAQHQSSLAASSQASGPKSSAFWRRGKKSKLAPFRPASLTFLNSQSAKRDGRLPISVKDTSHTGVLAKAVGAAVRRITPGDSSGSEEQKSESEIDEIDEPDDAAYTAAQTRAGMSLAAAEFSRVSRSLAHKKAPRLNVVIMVIGSRGDIQPFLKIGKVLKEKYGHRVRVATHPAFREFIEKGAGLEFFSAGGDPAELMAFMVKNPGMIPSLATVRSGDIGRRRDAMAEMFEGFWRACVDSTDDPNDVRNLKLVGDKEPFVADAIIANPPSYAHIHCAEALGVPLHLMFTFPYTPTQAFPHPLANIKKSAVDPGYTNFISYPLVDMMVWQGLGDLINNFRVKTLDLEPISTIWAPGAVYRMHVPFTYLWSPGLVPKPADWGPEIDIGGFVFLELASSFKPPASLEAFLAASEEPPIYIGFGSIVVDNADKFTEMIFEAVRMSGVRALVSKGWGGFGGKGDNIPDNIYMLENTPHDWLFPKVRACVIHGGAGTTAIALKCGLPTMVVPFFGDQFFWGSMIEKSNVGPKPVPYKRLTAESLADGIKYLLCQEARDAAQAIAESIELEGDGADNACTSFLRTLELEGHGSIRCAIFPDKVAVWQRKGSNIKLSALAAEALVEKGYMSYKNLRLLRHTEWNDFEGPGEPITAMFGSLARSSRAIISGPFSAASQIIRGGKKKRKDAKEKTAQKKAQKEVAKQEQVHDADSDTLADDDSSSFQGTGKAEEGSFEVVFAAVGQNIGRSAKALVMAPIDVYFSLCQGFHNAPRLYGDDTVRRPAHVTGIKSGLKAAGNEFIFGIYDGVTGIVRLPIRFARKGGGIHGFVRGVGMGIMGFVLKDISAIISPFGYALKGLARQAERGKQPLLYLRRNRIMEAQRDVRSMDAQEWKMHLQRASAGWEAMHELYRTVQQGGSSELAKRHAQKGPNANSAADGANGASSHGAVAIHTLAPRRGSADSVFQHHHYHPVGSSARQSLEDLDSALESADLAAIVLAAMRRGETLESVVRGRYVGPRPYKKRPCHRDCRPKGGLKAACRGQLAGQDKKGRDEELECKPAAIGSCDDDDNSSAGEEDPEEYASRARAVDIVLAQLGPDAGTARGRVDKESHKMERLRILQKVRDEMGDPGKIKAPAASTTTTSTAI